MQSQRQEEATDVFGSSQHTARANAQRALYALQLCDSDIAIDL
jgi:hypothetical protein